MTAGSTSPGGRDALRGEAQSILRAQLAADPAARAYLAERGIDRQLAVRLQLGAAGHSWTGLVDQLRARGYSDAQLLDAGVAFRSARGRTVDVFRSRVLFPAHDDRGRLVGWAGRSTPAAPPQAPHWLNSSAGDYRKGELLHGLHEGRQRLRAGAHVALCEGVLDAHAVTLATDGQCVGLAPGGTALTARQVEGLARAVAPPDSAATTRRVFVAFDGDRAGRQAALHAWPLLQDSPFIAAYVPLPDGTDPAELPHPTIRRALREAHPLEDLVVDEVLAAWPERHRWPTHTLGATQAAAGTIAGLRPHQVARQVGRVAADLEVPAADVTGAVVDAVASRARSRATVAARDQTPEVGKDLNQQGRRSARRVVSS